MEFVYFLIFIAAIIEIVVLVVFFRMAKNIRSLTLFITRQNFDTVGGIALLVSLGMKDKAREVVLDEFLKKMRKCDTYKIDMTELFDSVMSEELELVGYDKEELINVLQKYHPRCTKTNNCSEENAPSNSL